MQPGAIVGYESTVYPGATQEDCVPVLERASGLICGRNFTVGYSPERICLKPNARVAFDVKGLLDRRRSRKASTCCDFDPSDLCFPDQSPVAHPRPGAGAKNNCLSVIL
jgi:hypothetical protein